MFWLFLGWHVLGIIVGAFVSAIIDIRRRKKLNVGTIRLDQSDPDSPYLFLEMKSDGMLILHNNDYVILDVNLKNYISQ